MSKITISKAHTLKGHKDCIYTLERTSSPEVVFSGAADGYVVRWDSHEEESGRLMVRLPASVYALRYFEPADLLIVGQNFEGIHVINIKEKTQVGSLKLTTSAIFDIQVAGDQLWVACGDGSIHIVELKTLKLLKTLKHSEKSARCLAVNAQKKEVAVGYSDHRIRIFDALSFDMKQEIHAHTNSVFTLRYSPDQRWLISGSRDARLKFWDVEQHYELSEAIVAHMYAINHIDFSPSGKLMASCSMDKTVKIWDLESRKLLKVIDKARYSGHTTSVNKVVWEEEDRLCSASDDRTICVWKLTFEQPLKVS